LVDQQLGPAHPTEDRTPARPTPSLGERLTAPLMRIHAKVMVGLELSISRAVDEAFASLAREFRC
jgi:hypothetical protein